MPRNKPPAARPPESVLATFRGQTLRMRLRSAVLTGRVAAVTDFEIAILTADYGFIVPKGAIISAEKVPGPAGEDWIFSPGTKDLLTFFLGEPCNLLYGTRHAATGVLQSISLYEIVLARSTSSGAPMTPLIIWKAGLDWARFSKADLERVLGGSGRA
ncbi:MAG TPA: hypothetical protein PKJ51_00355 [Methanothrix sp.]|nr:hypothetical protein [Methanothrix sp.]